MPKRIPRWIGNHLAGAYLLLVCAAALSFVVIAILYKNQAEETQRLAKESLKLSLQIQQQRRESIFTTCRAQNERHLELTRFLRNQGLSLSDDPEAYAFVDKLAPIQNCREVVIKATNSP